MFRSTEPARRGRFHWLPLSLAAAVALWLIHPQFVAFPAHGTVAAREAWARSNIRQYGSLTRTVEKIPLIQELVGRVTAIAPTSGGQHAAAQTMDGVDMNMTLEVVGEKGTVSPLVAVPLILLARKAMPAKNLRELIDWLKANPNTASAAIENSGVHLLTSLFQRETGTQFTLVPYRGSAPAMQDLVAGQIDFLFDTPLQLPLVRAGSIKAYAVAIDTRMALAPDIPTFAEMGLPALSYSAWFGLFAPKGAPKDIIGKLNAATVDALAEPEVRSRLVDLGAEIFPRLQQTPEALAALVKAGAEKWWPLIKEFGIKAE
jgi:tripartite-type tricarboxylate transporter receptor subunit TctC